MYYKLYKNLRQLIADATGITLGSDGRVEQANDVLQDIQWFNNQYESTIHAAPVVFVEFQPLDISQLTKQNHSTEIPLRLHVVTQVMDESDNDVSDADVIDHEALAIKVLEAVEGERLTWLEGQTRLLTLTKWTHYHNYLGWMVTLIELKTKG